MIKKAPAAKPPPTSGAQAEGQLSSSIGVGKIASKFGKQDFAPPPEKPLKPKPKVAAPAGESTAASKKLFEQKIKEQVWIVDQEGYLEWSRSSGEWF